MTPNFRVLAGVVLTFPATIGAAAAAECAAPLVADIGAYLDQADCLAASGRAAQALAPLEAALDLAAGRGANDAERLAIHARLGRVFAGLGDYATAQRNLSEALTLAETTADAAAAASLLNDLGGVYMAVGRPLEGLSAYSDSARLAEGALAVTVSINLTRALWENGQNVDVTGRLGAASRDASALPDDEQKISALLAIGELYRALAQARPDASGPLRGLAFTQLEDALSVARRVGDDRLASFAYGYLGSLYADAGRTDDALALSRQAVATAQTADANDSLYRWEWQTGRLLRAVGEEDRAIGAYRAAVDTLQRMGPTRVASQRRFERTVAPLYAEYADMLLASTGGTPSDTAAGTLLEVQRALEQFRLAEVQNYFENQCVISGAFDPSAATGNAVVIYPVLLEDRTELLVSRGDERRQFTVDVGLEALTREIRLLRISIETAAAGQAYIQPARQLYDWLIAPLAETLGEAETLIFVPDGPLRTIPLGVLHDGERFLIERYAIATTPGLTLIGFDSRDRSDRRVLANGLAESVRGFPPLPFVEAELRSIERSFPARTLADEAFRTDALESEVLAGGYSIVHLATHAQFESSYRNSFLLAYDGLITMDQLEDVMGIQRFTDEPVDLIVLSACQTAAGDDRAALGLAGVAVKAGARSALASLWLINDESTSRLMQEFYRRLAAGAETKAEALRGAQLLLVNDTAYGHPSYWAPFLLIGDWR